MSEDSRTACDRRCDLPGPHKGSHCLAQTYGLHFTSDDWCNCACHRPPATTIKSDYMVTVCAACRCASCWHGEFMCQQSGTANTVDVAASVLRAENREHASNFSEGKLMNVCGNVKYIKETT